MISKTRTKIRYCSAMLSLTAVFVGTSVVATEPTVKELQWHRRVLIISAPSKHDARWGDQEQALAMWKGGDERDVTVVRIVGDSVSGSGEKAVQLRRRYSLSSSKFAVALIGKDGHVALVSSQIVTGAQLANVIDAMPMRRAGER